MRQDLLELIHLTELFLYENYSFAPASSNVKRNHPVKKVPPVSELPKVKPAAPPPSEKKPKTQVEIVVNPLPQPLVLPKKDYSEVEKLFKDKLPHVKLATSLTDDSTAKNQESEWQRSAEPIAYILITSSNAKELSFLEDLACAITSRFGLAKILTEKEYASQTSLPKDKLVILEPVSRYFENPTLKKALWTSLLERFS